MQLFNFRIEVTSLTATISFVILTTDTQRAISILEGILQDLEKMPDMTPSADNPDLHVQHLVNVQDMVDKMESPLFGSLLKMQNRHQQVVYAWHRVAGKHCGVAKICLHFVVQNCSATSE